MSPNNAVLLSNRAFAHVRLENYGSAIADASSAVESDPNYIKAYYRRGTSQYALGHLADALKDFKTVCRMQPQDRDGRLKLKECENALRKKRFEEAIAAPEDERARLHDVGTAARVVQIARKDSPVRSYTLLFEGRCRFAVDKLTAVHPFIVAEVRQLDAAGNGVQLNGGAGGDPEDDPELESVAASFKDRARELVDRLERRKGHARRLRSMLESAPAHRLADLFVAAFEDSFDARLELLSTTCPKVNFFSFTNFFIYARAIRYTDVVFCAQERMRKALSLVEAHLGQLDVTTDIAKKVEGRLSKTQREYLLRQQMQVSLFLFTYGRLV